MTHVQYPSQAELKTLFHYDPETGCFFRRDGKSRSAGCVKDSGYVRITINRQHFYAHRLAWLYTHGYLPERIDHIDGNPSNNSIKNLREATGSQNIANSRNRNQWGHKGIRPSASGKWIAQIMVDYKTIHLGTFDTKEQAASAYNEAAAHHFGEFARLS